MAGGPVISVEGLEKTYPESTRAVLRGLDLEVAEGAFLAVMGPSGSGKSTLLHLLGGLDTPTAGRIELAGRDLASLSDRELTELRRQTVSLIFQSYNLVPVLSVADNVALPRVIANAPAPSYQDRLRHCLDLVGLADRARDLPARLSGGEQQRVAIARALLPCPRVLLADEPTGNLDTASGAQVLDLLRRSVDEEGTTVVMVTHDPRAAAAADGVVLLADGVVAGRTRLSRSDPLDRRAAHILEWMARGREAPANNGGRRAPTAAATRKSRATPAAGR